jgi:transcriptional regulator NrdR family protein
VYESRGDRWQPVYHRRRQCADCRRDWPTVEILDRLRFRRELRAVGMKLDDLGLAE